MNSIGIIGEFNPFHKGHAYLIKETKKLVSDSIIISVMSGNFTQRGLPAFSDKWTRAKEAVNGGVNLVCELPVVYACNGAEIFGRGGMQIIKGFGAIDYISFGSESGDIKELNKIKEILDKNGELLNQRTKSFLRKGFSYPKARELILSEILEKDGNIDNFSNLISGSNNILAIEYLKNIDKDISPITIRRAGNSHDESATALRKKLLSENPDLYKKIEYNFFILLSWSIMRNDSDFLQDIWSAGEGLGNKLKKEIRYAKSLEDLVDRVKSKAYTRTRIYRLLSQTILGITKESIYNAKPYIRILAVDQKGREFLNYVKKNKRNSIPIITNINKDLEENKDIIQTIEKDILASDTYNLITESDLYIHSDYIKKPYIGV